MRIPVEVVFAAAVALLPGVTVAQQRHGPGGLDEVLNQAERNAAAKRYDEAIAGYRRAFELSGDPLYHYNVSVILLSRKGDGLAAWEFARRFADEARTEQDRRDALLWIEKVEREISRTHGRVVVKGLPAGGTAWLDREADETAFRRGEKWSTPGPHRLIVKTPGRDPVDLAVEVRAGASSEVDMPPAPATLIVTCEAAGCRVTVDGKGPGGPEMAWRLAPGVHHIHAEARGTAFDADITLASGETRTVRPEFIQAKALAPAPPPRKAPRLRSWAWGTAIAGGALLTAGTVLYVVARKDLSDASGMGHPKSLEDKAFYDSFNGKVDRGKALGYSAYAAWGLGAAALGTGVLMFMMEGR